MILYLSVIFLSTIVITGLNIAFSSGHAFIIVMVCVINVLGMIAFDALVAALTMKFPEKWFRHDKKIFTVSRKEKNFYEKLKIRKWKEKIPELGGLGGFSKGRIVDPSNNEYVERYLLEICYGQADHFFGIFLGFILMFFFPRAYWLGIGLPIAIINVFLNVPSIFILRYNSYKLEIVYKANARRDKKISDKTKACGVEASQKTREVEKNNTSKSLSDIAHSIKSSQEGESAATIQM